MAKEENKTNYDEESSLDEYSVSVRYPVLVIDDDKMIQVVFEKFLNNWGFKTISTIDPYEGIALAVKHRPAFIILDIFLPELKGEHILKTLKKIELTSRIPIVIVSANLSMDLLNATYRDGADGFLSKPFSQQDLHKCIESVISPSVFKKMAIDGFVEVNEEPEK